MSDALKADIEKHQNAPDKDGKALSASAGLPGKVAPRVRRTVKGHQRKVYCVQWSGDSRLVASGGQEGFVLVTNPVTGMKVTAPVKASFVMATALNSTGKMLLHGGMDNKITVTDISAATPVTKKEIVGHDGYLSGLRFVPGDDSKFLSASGDGESWLYETATGKVITKFVGHTGDCGAIATAPDINTYFITASTDKTLRVWDINSGKCVRTFITPSECNACAIFPNGMGAAYACEGGEFGSFDIGSYCKIGQGKTGSKGAGASVAVSRSGMMCYVGFEKGAINVCNFFDMSQYDGVTGAHESNVCSLAMAPDGTALASSGYDGLVKIWAGPGA